MLLVSRTFCQFLWQFWSFTISALVTLLPPLNPGANGFSGEPHPTENVTDLPDDLTSLKLCPYDC